MNEASQAQLMERIILIESRLSMTIDKLTDLIETVQANQENFFEYFNGNSVTPGMVSRIITLEEFRRTSIWMIGVLYVALVSALVGLLVNGFKG